MCWKKKHNFWVGVRRNSLENFLLLQQTLKHENINNNLNWVGKIDFII